MKDIVKFHLALLFLFYSGFSLANERCTKKVNKALKAYKIPPAIQNIALARKLTNKLNLVAKNKSRIRGPLPYATLLGNRYYIKGNIDTTTIELITTKETQVLMYKISKKNHKKYWCFDD